MAPKTAHKYTTEFTTPSDRELVAVRFVDAPRTLVWDVHTKPEHVRKWMLGPDGWSMPVCEIDLRPGGRWRYVYRKDDGSEQFELGGEFREIVPPERLVHTEAWGGDFAEALDTLVLTEKDGRTTITTTILFPDKEARDRAMGTGMTEGWAQSYDKLDEVLPTLMGR
ncbi:MAG: SRPBCC family protein [Acidobacteria bacterium]|nr:SRPBCC family protein [Acidobacteriota bacterium]